MLGLLILLGGLFVPIIIYANRFLIPDTSYDAVNYHLFVGQRGLHNWFLPFGPKEFYPNGLFTFAPFHDVLNYLFIASFGYRLGTLPTLLAYLLTGYLLYKIIRLFLPSIRPTQQLGVALLLVNCFIVFELLFEIATYYIEIENTFFMVAGLYFLLVFLKKLPLPGSITTRDFQPFLLAMIFFGLGLWGKLINLEYIVPLFVLLLWIFAKHVNDSRRKRLLFFCLGMLILGVFTLPMTIFNYSQTGNPVFPMFNGVFHAKYYAAVDFSNPLWGGSNLIQKIIWPVYSIIDHQRLGELHTQFNDFKLNFYWLVSVSMFGLLLLRRIKLSLPEKFLLLFFLASSVLWSFVCEGYVRYGTFLELLGGLLLVIYFIRYRTQPWQKLLWFLIIAGLTIDNLLIFKHNLSFDYSFRPSLRSNMALHRSQVHSLFAKQMDLSAQILTLGNQADIIVNCYPPSTSYYVVTPFITKPMVLLDPIGSAAMVDNKNYQAKIQTLIQKDLPNKDILHFVSISYFIVPDDSDLCLTALKKTGYVIEQTAVSADFLGYNNIKLKFIFGTVPLKNL